MKAFRVGNAPCSWGTLEFHQAKGEQITFDRMLNELVETGTPARNWAIGDTCPLIPPRSLRTQKA